MGEFCNLDNRELRQCIIESLDEKTIGLIHTKSPRFKLDAKFKFLGMQIIENKRKEMKIRNRNIRNDQIMDMILKKLTNEMISETPPNGTTIDSA
jgi:hypothetical protein